MQSGIYLSPLGKIILAADRGALIGLWFSGQKYERAGLSGTEPESAEPVLDQAEAWLDAYFSRRELPPAPLLAPRGTGFQKRVWLELMNIPFGATVSYGELAERLGCTAPRAVGAAVGRNPISIIIPCHRVLGSGGRLTGYAGGIQRKKALLELEERFT